MFIFHILKNQLSLWLSVAAFFVTQSNLKSERFLYLPLLPLPHPHPTMLPTVHHWSRNREILRSLMNCHSPLLLGTSGLTLQWPGKRHDKSRDAHLNSHSTSPHHMKSFLLGVWPISLREKWYFWLVLPSAKEFSTWSGRGGSPGPTVGCGVKV